MNMATNNLWLHRELRPCEHGAEGAEDTIMVQRTTRKWGYEIPSKRCKVCGHQWFTGPAVRVEFAGENA